MRNVLCGFFGLAKKRSALKKFFAVCSCPKRMRGSRQSGGTRRQNYCNIEVFKDKKWLYNKIGVEDSHHCLMSNNLRSNTKIFHSVLDFVKRN